MVKPGAVVIDVGVNRIPDPEAKNGSRLVGDVDFAGYNHRRPHHPQSRRRGTHDHRHAAAQHRPRRRPRQRPQP